MNELIKIEEHEARTIPGFSGYMVSDNGEVYSKNYNKTGIIRKMKQRANRDGYMQVQITRDDGQPKRVTVHRLVAITFLEKINGKEHVNHKNGNKSDNRVENLEWCTPSENIKHALYVTKTQSIERVKKLALKNIEQRRKNPKLTVEQINEIEEIYNTTQTSHRQLAKKYGCGKTLIGTVLEIRREERNTIEDILKMYSNGKMLYDINGNPFSLEYILKQFNCKVDGKGQVYFVNKFLKEVN